jgi:excinuclease UvrABC nuclease subunit
MFDISAADILKGVFLPLITLFITIVKTPFRIRQENHGKLRALLESVESNKGERIQLLLFRDYMRSKNASLLELQQLLALPDAIRALELYRFTHSQQQILRVTPSGK